MSSRIRIFTALIALTAIAASAPEARAALPPWLEGPPSDGGHVEALPLDDADAVIGQGTSGDDRGYVDLLHRVSLSVDARGNLSERVVVARLFTTDAGAVNGGDLRFHARANFDRARLRAAYVLTADRRRIPVDERTVQVRDTDDRHVFSDYKEIVVPLPGISRGAIAVMESEISSPADRWPLPWSREYLLHGTGPIRLFEVDFRWQGERPAWATNDPELACEEGRRRLRCTRSMAPSYEADVDLGAALDSLNSIAFGKELGWSELADEVAGIVESQLAAGLSSEQVDAIVGDAQSDEEKWEAIFRFVADSVRYIGLEHGSSAVVPRPPGVTYERRYGDCKDKVTLLIALARAAGLDAHAALVATKRFERARILIPGAFAFDHMIACRPGGSCVDPTVPRVSAAESALPSAGASMLVLDRGTAGLAPVETSSPYGIQIDIDSDVEVACDGSTRQQSARKLSGLAAIQLRNGFGASTSSERVRNLESEFQSVMQTARAPRFDIVHLNEASEPVTLKSTLVIPASSSLDQSAAYADADPWFAYYTAAMRSENRFYRHISSGMRLVSRRQYRFCDRVVPGSPGPVLDFVSDFGSVKRHYKKSGDQLHIRTIVEIPRRVIYPEDRQRFNSFLDASVAQSRVWVQLLHVEDGAKPPDD